MGTTNQKNAMQEHSAGYIIDLYNKFAKNLDVVAVFNLHGQSYCIREVTHFDWGKPVFNQSLEDDFDHYRVYASIDEAQKYIRQLKKIDGSGV